MQNFEEIVHEAFRQYGVELQPQHVEEAIRIGLLLCGLKLYVASFADREDSAVARMQFRTSNALDQLQSPEQRDMLTGMLEHAGIKARALDSDDEELAEILPGTLLFLLPGELVNAIMRAAKQIGDSEFDRICAEDGEDDEVQE